MRSVPTFLRTLAGRRRDWHLVRPRRPRVRPHIGWLGPLGVLGSIVVSWFAFSGAQGEGDVAFGLFIGAASIIAMAWSFILALRIKVLEAFFGGLDRMYRLHRWLGTLAVVAMFWHIRIEPEVDGILGASRAVADSAEELAGTGELLLYGLVGASLLRWIPYRWWRWTHKLFGVPYAFACWHFFTSEKPYANGSPWGWYFGAIMVAGLVAWLWRVVVRDGIFRGRRYRITRVTRDDDVTTIAMAPLGRRLRQRAGQFVFLKVQERGLSEPHPFTIASSPASDELEFVIRDLGDWSHRLQTADLVGSDVLVEGPYGTFEPVGHAGQRVVWISGGVGITPFLSALDDRPEGTPTPELFYATRGAETSSVVARLRRAHDDGRIVLHLFDSAVGDRLDAETFRRLVGGSLDGAHVALCGPAALVAEYADLSARLGAAEVETEDFDIRQGFGPDLSREIDRLVGGKGGVRRRDAAPASAVGSEPIEASGPGDPHADVESPRATTVAP